MGQVMSYCLRPAPCLTLIHECMNRDDGTPGQVHTCHITGMTDGTEAQCQALLGTCNTACGAATVLDPSDPLAMCYDAGK